jgi:hypothetical protein
MRSDARFDSVNFDLETIYRGWHCQGDELAARLVRGIDGSDVLQLRVELGLLQMNPDGRPDGADYRGRATVLDHVRTELEAQATVDPEAWQALRRELNQFNYRRLALTCLVEDAANDDDTELARMQLSRTIRDIDHCLSILRLAQQEHPPAVSGNLTLIPTLIFNRARLLARLRSIEQRYDEAIEEAEAGAEALTHALEGAGFEPEQIDEDAGVDYLRQFARRLREQSGIDRTLQEQLADAIDDEDFEAAAHLHQRLHGRCDPDSAGS